MRLMSNVNPGRKATTRTSLRQTNSGAWARLRARILHRDLHACRYCGAPATEVDHVIPVAHGGTDAAWNLAACCWDCGHFANVEVKLKQLEAQGKP